MTLMFEAHVAPIYRCVVIFQLIIRHGDDHLLLRDDRNVAVAVSRSFPGVALDHINGAVGLTQLAAQGRATALEGWTPSGTSCDCCSHPDSRSGVNRAFARYFSVEVVP